MKTGVVVLCLCTFFFLLPLQCYTIGNDIGMGIQGAVYRFQVTAYGNSLIPLTSELRYILTGEYEGRTAFSVLFWASGTGILMLITVYSLLVNTCPTPRQVLIIITGLTGACAGYLISCMIQYGPFLSGLAGRTLPLGIVIMLLAAVGLYVYRDTFIRDPTRQD